MSFSAKSEVEVEKEPKAERTKEDSLNFQLPLEDACVKCKGHSHRDTVYHDTYFAKEHAITATYVCEKCKHKQGLRVSTPSFIKWYLENFKGNKS